MSRQEISRRKFLTGLTLTGGVIALAGRATSACALSRSPGINIGIIGTGDRGAGLASLIKRIPDINLAACCDILPFRLANGMQYANKKTRQYSDYRFLLDQKDIDAVVVATPFSTHADIAVDALDAGKHVFCEKTMAYGYQDIKKLSRKVADSDLVFQTGHQYHSSRLYRHIVELVQAGKIGAVGAIECQWNRNGDWRRPTPDPKWEKLINWRMYREFSGGLVAELCSHQIDFTNWLLASRPAKVTGFGGIDYWKDGRETYDNVHIMTEYPSGVKARYTCLTTNSRDGYQIKIFGKEGTIVINKEKAWLYSEQVEQKDTAIVDGVTGATQTSWGVSGTPIEVEHKNPSMQALLDFKSAVLTGSKPLSNVKSGADVSVVVQMALDAMDNGTVEYWRDKYDFAG